MAELPPAVVELGRTIRGYLLPLLVGEIGVNHQRVDDNGTAFLLKPENDVFLVTAAHVFRAAESLACDHPGARVGIGQFRLSLVDRLINVSDDLDIATFRVTPDEVLSLGAQPVAIGRSGWPPPVPSVGDIAVIAGYPAQERCDAEYGVIDHGIYTAALRVHDVGHRHISFVIDNAELDDHLGSGLPPSGYRLGGLSGGPVVVIEPGSILSWRLCGIMKQQSTMSVGDIVQVVRADFITGTGEIAAGAV